MTERRLSEHRLRESPFWVRESNAISFSLSQFLSSQEVLREELEGHTGCDGSFVIFGGPHTS